jgi:hypothetical protein
LPLQQVAAAAGQDRTHHGQFQRCGVETVALEESRQAAVGVEQEAAALRVEQRACEHRIDQRHRFGQRQPAA